MADLQISQLPTLAEADLASGDELAIVDGSASETKRITAKALVEKIKRNKVYTICFNKFVIFIIIFCSLKCLLSLKIN